MHTHAALLAATALAGFALALPARAQDGSPETYSAEITRTAYNIPHIVADDWRGLGYGIAYAYAQDNICLLAEEFVTVAGTRSQHFGPDEPMVLGFAEADNLTSDIFFRSQIDLEALRATWPGQPERVRALVDGYIKGYNRFVRDAGADGLPEECRGADWVRPIGPDDMLRLNEKQMLLAGSLALGAGIAGAAPPNAPQPAAAEVSLDQRGEPQLGSNGWAFGAETTADGRGLLIGNPHFPWKGPSRFWQMHATIPGEYDVMGVGLAGTPLPTLGFNKDVAWTHTVTAARHFTLYALELAEGDPTRYMVDGEPVEMTAKTVSVPMPGGAEPITRTLWSTRFGPIVTMPGQGVTWNAKSAFTILDANSRNQRAIDTWLRIGKAKTVAEVEAAVSESLGIPWVNTIAADREGNALHADITAVPNVSAEMVEACATPMSPLFASLVTLLDGTRSACNWRGDLLPASEQASRQRRDWLANSNDSYWLSNPAHPYRELSPILGAHEKPLSLRTRSNYTETSALLGATKMDHAAAKGLVFANKSLGADLVVGPLLALCEGSNSLAQACAALAGWDREFETGSQGAYLFTRFWDKVKGRRDLWLVPFDPAAPVKTPRDLNTEGATGTALLAALGEAADELGEAGIALDAPWGEVLTQPVPGGQAIAIHGGPGWAGVLNMQEGTKVEGGMIPRHGSSYIQIVGFDEDGPVADAILSYSQSSNPASEHYSDQTRLYSAKQWNRLPFSREEIEASQTGDTLRISE